LSLLFNFNECTLLNQRKKQGGEDIALCGHQTMTLLFVLWSTPYWAHWIGIGNHHMALYGMYPCAT
jgi:hypothetical protein